MVLLHMVNIALDNTHTDSIYLHVYNNWQQLNKKIIIIFFMK